MNWYINKKTNELVQAEKGVRLWTIITTSGYQMYLSNFDFQSQYGEAMVNNPMIPADDKPHIKDRFCDNLGCIPYIPKQKQADEEPVFPVCGTCNARKNSKPNSSLLLSEMKAVEKAIELQKYSEDEGYVLMPADYYRAGMVAELNHLAKLRIVYVSRQVKCDECDGSGEIKVWENEGEDYCMEGCTICNSKGFYLVYISLSDYMKGDK